LALNTPTRYIHAPDRDSGQKEVVAGKRWAHSAQSPGALALREHAGLCRRCADVGALGLPPRALCGAGWILYVAAVRARARRAS
jgi:hypothetical protein